MKKSKKNNKGFSLVELIVVVLILGILAVAVTPQIMTWIDKSHVAKDESYAGTASSAIEAVALEFIGQGKQDKIPEQIVIMDKAIKCFKNDTDTSALADTDEFVKAVKAAFAEGDKCSKPSQNSMNAFYVEVKVNSTNKTVSVKTAATSATK